MSPELRPTLRDLARVLPAIQAEARGEWAVTLVSVELWANGFVANFDVAQEEQAAVDRRDGGLPRLELALAAGDDRGGRYRDWFGGGWGGGHPGRIHYRFVRIGTPAVDPAARELRLEARLRLAPPGGAARGSGGDATELGAWRFVVPLPAPSGGAAGEGA